MIFFIAVGIGIAAVLLLLIANNQANAQAQTPGQLITQKYPVNVVYESPNTVVLQGDLIIEGIWKSIQQLC
jgi:hypothetical protein